VELVNLDQIKALMQLMRENGALHVQCGDIVITLGAAPAPVDATWEDTDDEERPLDNYEQLGLPTFAPKRPQ
jgi:hypothetical protein